MSTSTKLLTDLAPPEASQTTVVVDREGRWRRSPSDVVRLLLAFGFVVLLVLLVRLTSTAVEHVSSDVADLVVRLPGLVVSVLVGTMQLLGLAAPLVVLVLLGWRRRWALLGVTALAVALAASTMTVVASLLSDAVPSLVRQRADGDSWIAGAAFPSATYAAAAVAAITVLSPWLNRRWRKASIALVLVLLVTRLLSATETAFALVGALGVGVMAGSAVLVVFGAPVRRLAASTITTVMARVGLDVGPLTPTGRGSNYTTTTTGGKRLRVLVAGRDERDADLLARVVRAVRVKDLVDSTPSSSPEVALEHEALATLLAAKAGASVPSVELVADVGDGWAVLVQDELGGRSLAELGPDEVTDDVLLALWRQVAQLRQRGVAHRQLNVHHVRVVDGQLWLTDLRYADLSAADRVLALDVAELLASTAVLVGPERAVAPAVAQLGPEAVGATLPLLQPLALTNETRSETKRQKHLVDQVREAAQHAAGVEAYELAKIQRIGLRQIITVVASALVIYILALQFGNAEDAWTALSQMNWAVLPVLIVLAMLPYPAGAISLMGAVKPRLPFVQASVMMCAQSVLNRFTPANAGGMALRVRYLQRRGIDLTQGVSALGLTSMASGIVQVVFLVVFFAWAGTSNGGSFSLPTRSIVLLVLLIVLVVAGVVIFTNWGRKLFGQAKTVVMEAWHTVHDLARSPAKMLELFGGAAASKLLSIVALTTTMRAFGQPVDFPQVAAMYLTATTIAAAVPTPGGMGAIEAALVAGLTGIGVDSSTAVSITIVYRAVTYWFPILPGWIALVYLERKEIV